MSRAGHVAVVSALTRQKKRQDEFTDISTVSTINNDTSASSSAAVSSDGQPLWPWNPKHPEKYRTDRAGLPKREDLSKGLKLRKACGIILMLAFFIGLAIAIYLHVPNTESKSSNRPVDHRVSNHSSSVKQDPGGVTNLTHAN